MTSIDKAASGRALRALVLEHWRSDAFVVYGEVLADREIEVDRVLASEVDRLPDWRAYDLILALGGPASVYEEDAYPWLVGEKRLIREAVDSGVPYFGVCFGAQLLASALGAEVYLGAGAGARAQPRLLDRGGAARSRFSGTPSRSGGVRMAPRCLRAAARC